MTSSTTVLSHERALKNITIYGDGTQTLSFCFANDLVRGLMALMDGPADLVGAINLGHPTEFTMLRLAELTIELNGSTTKIVHLPLPQSDPCQRHPNISLARTPLGWEPDIALRAVRQFSIRHGSVAAISRRRRGRRRSALRTRSAAVHKIR